MGNYSYNAPRVDDAQQIRLTAVKDAPTIKIQIIAIDATGKSNSITVPVKIATEDTDKPTLDNTTTKVKTVEGGYEVTLGFVDKTSGVVSVDVTLPDGTSKSLKGAIVSLTTASAGTVQYRAKDLFGNTLEGSLTMADYL